MKRASLEPWLPFGFSVALSAIALVSSVATGNSGAWIPAFIFFLPMTFFFAAISEKNTRERLQALEARLERMEAGGLPWPRTRRGRTSRRGNRWPSPH